MFLTANIDIFFHMNIAKIADSIDKITKYV
jgi:hypothetical protein